jgi:hypothetical protein
MPFHVDSHQAKLSAITQLGKSAERKSVYLTIYFINIFIAYLEHQNYLGIDENYGPFALSVKKEESNKQYRAILWLSEVKIILFRIIITILC